MKLPFNLIGKQYGKLIVTAVAPNKNGRVQWQCKCKCGNERIIWASNLLRGFSKSCGCIRHENIGAKNPTWKGYGEIGSKYFKQLKAGALRRNHIFEITIQQLWKLAIKQNKKCALSGLPITFERIKGVMFGSASVDRIDSTKGYVIDNVQWVHKDINWMKQHFNQEVFIGYCCNICQHRNEQKSTDRPH